MMKWIYFLFIALMVFTAIWMSSKSAAGSAQVITKLDIQGHRGARGLLPENTIPAFKKALDLNVNTLELDLSVTSDGFLVISHEPWISPEICRYPDGKDIPETINQDLNIYQMTYEEVRSFDCGSKTHARFPDQQKINVSKPLLTEMIREMEAYGSQIGYNSFSYNIEIKSQPEGDNLFHPQPADFADLVFVTINELLNWDRVTIQSFDFRVLQYFNENYPEVRLVALVENRDSWQDNLTKLGFTPEVYSPFYKYLTEENISAMQRAGMKVIPWTINTPEEMQQLIDWGVDGIITDYPNIAVNLTEQR